MAGWRRGRQLVESDPTAGTPSTSRLPVSASPRLLLSSSPLAVELRGITKRFGPVVANDAVDFTACWGEVHALVGENGAGKSTLMSIVAGLYRPDAGEVRIGGRAVRFRSPRDAIAHSIGMVYQHFMLVEPFTVAENVALAAPDAGRFLATGPIEAALTRLGRAHGLAVDPRAPVWQLSVGEQQRVEILRLLYLGARILILDEPTAVLTPQEAAGLIATLRGLAQQGFSVVFISHKLDEVLAVADRITVMRGGRVVATNEPAVTDRRALARQMVGRDLAAFVEHPDAEPHEAVVPGSAVLAIAGLRAIGDNGLEALRGIDLAVRASETLGVAGVAGNGQRELAEVITGLRPASGGRVTIGGRDLTGRGPAAIARAGVAHIPEDRLATGLVGSLDIAENAILRHYRRPPLSRGPFLVSRSVSAFADRLIRDGEVRAPGRWAKVGTLSGGNQQKLLLARELVGDPKVIVAVHPTRGVDVGATEAIHGRLREQRGRGAATLLISEDLDEVLALADRIAVLYEGRIVGELATAGADLERIGLLMAGVTDEIGAAGG